MYKATINHSGETVNIGLAIPGSDHREYSIFIGNNVIETCYHPDSFPTQSTAEDENQSFERHSSIDGLMNHIGRENISPSLAMCLMDTAA